MKRRILLKKLARQAKIEGLDIVIPRHSEINEITARAILQHMGVQR